MERDRNAKILAVIALTVAVIGLSIGFAAFSQTLTIHSSAVVDPDETEFTSNVKFVTSDDETEGTVSGVPGETGGTAEDATLSATEITGIKATFKKLGQSVTYTFKVKNESPYVAYLRGINFKNVDNTPIECTKVTHEGHPEEEAVDGDVALACQGIHVSVKVGASGPYTESNDKITGHSLVAKTGEENVEVKIEYTGENTTDGDFNVAIGDIELTYASRDGTGA